MRQVYHRTPSKGRARCTLVVPLSDHVLLLRRFTRGARSAQFPFSRLTFTQPSSARLYLKSCQDLRLSRPHTVPHKDDPRQPHLPSVCSQSGRRTAHHAEIVSDQALANGRGVSLPGNGYHSTYDARHRVRANLTLPGQLHTL